MFFLFIIMEGGSLTVYYLVIEHDCKTTEFKAVNTYTERISVAMVRSKLLLENNLLYLGGNRRIIK